jgi:dTDP-4-amino-4,6-dideoxygalactose transaminase
MRNNLTIHPSFQTKQDTVSVPFMRPHIGDAEINEVISTLRSGWLTTGARVKKFEEKFAEAVKGKFAVALNSCTAALHLAVEALGLREGQAVLVPTMTFAATAEIILYKNAIPILVDCDPVTGNMDLHDAESKIKKLRMGSFPIGSDLPIEVVGIIPVHVGGYMLNIREVHEFAQKHDLWVVEDAAHAFPAAWREDAESDWQFCGEDTAAVTCYSFYANKTITTGEGGMVVTNNQVIAERIRLMSLHGLSHDAWGRYSGNGNWDYRIILPGYKYNLTDIAGAVGIHQLERGEEMRRDRETIAAFYLDELSDVPELELPLWDDDRIHSWHLFPVRLNLQNLTIDRNEFMERLKSAGVGCSVHWRPLHLHPLYIERFGWDAADFPSATELWHRLVSLPIFSSMSIGEMHHVAEIVKEICAEAAVSKISMVA